MKTKSNQPSSDNSSIDNRKTLRQGIGVAAGKRIGAWLRSLEWPQRSGFQAPDNAVEIAGTMGVMSGQDFSRTLTRGNVSLDSVVLALAIQKMEFDQQLGPPARPSLALGGLYRLTIKFRCDFDLGSHKSESKAIEEWYDQFTVRELCSLLATRYHRHCWNCLRAVVAMKDTKSADSVRRIRKRLKEAGFDEKLCDSMAIDELLVKAKERRRELFEEIEEHASELSDAYVKDTNDKFVIEYSRPLSDSAQLDFLVDTWMSYVIQAVMVLESLTETPRSLEYLIGWLTPTNI